MKALLATILLIASITLAPTRLQADEAHYDNLIRELESVRALAQRYRKTDQTHPIVFRYDAFDRRVAGLIADIKYVSSTDRSTDLSRGEDVM